MINTLIPDTARPYYHAGGDAGKYYMASISIKPPVSGIIPYISPPTGCITTEKWM
jgi:hypothetical protein